MVGVPGRSKACNTCRQRRIACGLERPQCKQCIKSNRMCGGYQRERIFVSSNTTVEDNIKKYTNQTYQKPVVKRKNDVVLPLRGTPIVTPELSSTDAIVLHQTIAPGSIYRQQILSDFISCYIPGADNVISQRPTAEASGSWLMMLAEIPSWTKALETSMLAVCIVKLGRIWNNEALVKESMKMYGQGLWEVQKALWDPKLMYRDETLAACMALLMYETIECPSNSEIGWFSHSGGCARLVELRGPKAHQSALAHSLFRAIRWTTILQCISLQKPTYLADPEWMSIPWQNTSKTLLDRLVDIYAEGVRINASGHELEEKDQTTILLPILKIIKRCWQVDAQLQAIWEELKDQTLGPLYWPEFAKWDNPADDEEKGKVFPVALWFPNMQTATTCLLYWTFNVIMCTGLTALYMIIPTLPPQKDFLFPPPSPEEETDGAATTTPSCSASASNDEPSTTPSTDSKSTTSSPSATSYTTTTSSSLPPSSDTNSTSPPQQTPPSACSPPLPFFPNGLPPLEHRTDLLTFARPICESVEYFLQDGMRAMGPSMMAFPLQVVTANLKVRPDLKRELDWCLATLARMAERGMRVLNVTDSGEKLKAKGNVPAEAGVI